MTTLQQALPNTNDVDPDSLMARLDVYSESCVLTTYHGAITGTRLVHPNDIAGAFMREVSLSTGILPPDVLWWAQTREGPVTALWRPPKVWRVALSLSATQPPQRYSLPMPGLVFVCSPGKAPWVWAAKKRPSHLASKVYAAPLYNVFSSGRTCPGSQKYPQRVSEAPETFFAAFFTMAGNRENRSKKFPHDLGLLWRELDDMPKFPTRDLVEFGRVSDLPGMNGAKLDRVTGAPEWEDAANDRRATQVLEDFDDTQEEDDE